MTNPRAKQLTYIVNYISSDDVQHYVHIPNLLNHLEALGWEVELLSEQGGKGRATVLGREVSFLSESSKVHRAAALVGQLLRMRIRGGRLVFVRISQPTAILSALLGRMLGWKTIYWLSDVKEDVDVRRSWGKLRIARTHLLLKLVHRLATGPEGMVHYYVRTYRMPEKRILLLYNDIDLSNIPPSNGPRSEETVNVLLVHRLAPTRETLRYFPSILAALERFARATQKTVVLDVCGDGPERLALEKLSYATPRAITIRFHGAVPQRLLGSFYDQASLFLMPSYREGFPRVIIEAMARGIPIVSTDAGGTRDLFGPKQVAYVIDRNDFDGFGAMVESLLSSEEDRRTLGAENLEYVKRFDTREVARMYDRALSGLIAVPPAEQAREIAR